MRRRYERFDTGDPARDDSASICWSVLLYVVQFLATLWDLASGAEIYHETANGAEDAYPFLWIFGYFLGIGVLCCEFFLVIYVTGESFEIANNRAQRHIFLCTKASFFFGFLKDIAGLIAKLFPAIHHKVLKSDLQRSACEVSCAASFAHFVLFILQF